MAASRRLRPSVVSAIAMTAVMQAKATLYSPMMKNEVGRYTAATIASTAANSTGSRRTRVRAR